MSTNVKPYLINKQFYNYYVQGDIPLNKAPLEWPTYNIVYFTIQC